MTRTPFEDELTDRLGALADVAPTRPSELRGPVGSTTEAVEVMSPRVTGSGEERDIVADQRPRWAAVAALVAAAVGLVSALVLLSGGGGVDRQVVTSSPTPETGSPSTEAGPTVETVPVPTTAVELDAAALGTTIAIVPDGPYVEGQQVTLVFSAALGLDISNWSASLCGGPVDTDEETCDVTDLRPEILSSSQPADGLDRLGYTLTRAHFGPTGWNDCGAADFRCRIVQRDDRGGFIASSDLVFAGVPPQPQVTLTVTPTDTAGQFVVDPDGIDLDPDPLELVTEAELESFARMGGVYDPEQAVVSWGLSGLCAYGQGRPPVGSEALAEVPDWWPAAFRGGDSWSRAEDPEGGRTVLLNAECDWRSVRGAPAPDDPNAAFTIDVDRSLYGYGGYLDCAEVQCFVRLSVSVFHPLVAGGTTGFWRELSAALVPVDALLPAPVLPSIAIVEAAPYTPGQSVTVEVRNLRSGHGGLVAWCDPDAAFGCGYRNTRLDGDGVRRVEWEIPAGTACGLDRCYFAIDSEGEGLAPPAVVVAPVIT
jgi:hypothetical protein